MLHMKKNLKLSLVICIGVFFQNCEKEEGTIASNSNTSDPIVHNTSTKGVKNNLP